MEEVKVSELPVATNVNDNDLIMIVQGGYNKKVEKQTLLSDTETEIQALDTKTTVKTTTVSGTLSNYGNISLGLSVATAKVLGVSGSGGQYIPFLSNTGDWYAYSTGTTSTGTTLNVNKGTSVSLTVYYIEL